MQIPFGINTVGVKDHTGLHLSYEMKPLEMRTKGNFYNSLLIDCFTVYFNQK